MALVDLGPELLDYLGGGALVFSPVLMDTKEIPECDVALVEGSIRNSENLENLKAIRARAKTLVALGTCACFGGVPALGSAFPTLELLLKGYGEGFEPDDLPVLEPRVYPLDSWVAVDYYLPGCPPPAAKLREAIRCLAKGDKPGHQDAPVCSDCQRVAHKGVCPDVKRMVDTVPNAQECLLSQGYLCLGSVSRNGCGAACTHAGVPCTGCRGPIDRVLTDPSHGILYDLIRRISHFTGKSEKEVKQKLPDMLHTLYGYTLSMPELRRKDAESVGELIYRIEV